LELPSYRRPQIGKGILRSIIVRTLFVLARAVMVAAPAGLVLWLMANTSVNGSALLDITAGFLDPFGQMLGMDGVIILAFILGWPANEIVIPIIIMTYLSAGSVTDINNLTDLRVLLVDNGWTVVTAVSTLLFMLLHWPCSTTALTIRKETQSFKWTFVSILIPTVLGISICFIFNTAVGMFLP
jgi:ferrous iron transport protein B